MSLTRMQQRRGTSTQWTGVGGSVVLADGEIAIESDTRKIKIGDGSNHWNDLPYFQTETINAAEYAKKSGTILSDTLSIGGATLIGGSLGVTGLSTLGSASVSTTLGVLGLSTLNSASISTTLGVTGLSTLNSASVSTTLGVIGDTTLSTVTVSGAANLQSTLSVATSISINGKDIEKMLIMGAYY